MKRALRHAQVGNPQHHPARPSLPFCENSDLALDAKHSYVLFDTCELTFWQHHEQRFMTQQAHPASFSKPLHRLLLDISQASTRNLKAVPNFILSTPKTGYNWIEYHIVTVFQPLVHGVA
jgi:hypothetical protein